MQLALVRDSRAAAATVALFLVAPAPQIRLATLLQRTEVIFDKRDAIP